MAAVHGFSRANAKNLFGNYNDGLRTAHSAWSGHFVARAELRFVLPLAANKLGAHQRAEHAKLEKGVRTPSHRPVSADRKIASIPAMFPIASSTETGTSVSSRIAFENAS